MSTITVTLTTEQRDILLDALRDEVAQMHSRDTRRKPAKEAIYALDSAQERRDGWVSPYGKVSDPGGFGVVSARRMSLTEPANVLGKIEGYAVMDATTGEQIVCDKDGTRYYRPVTSEDGKVTWEEHDVVVTRNSDSHLQPKTGTPDTEPPVRDLFDADGRLQIPRYKIDARTPRYVRSVYGPDLRPRLEYGDRPGFDGRPPLVMGPEDDDDLA